MASRGAFLKQAFAQRRLLAQVRGRRRPRARRGRTPQPKIPKAIARDYLAFMLPILARARSLVERHLLPQIPALARQANPNLDGLRADAGYSDTVEQILQLIRRELAAQIRDPEVKAQLQAMARRVDEFSAREVAAQVKRITALDVVASAGDLFPRVDAFVKQNVSLIKSLPEQYLTDVEAIVMRNFRQGRRAADIAAELRERFEISENRAALIAQDQVNKFNGELNKARHEALGVTRYIWRSSQDERVRTDPRTAANPLVGHGHAERNGHVFRYDTPPEDGHPGQPIRCRCTADPVIEDVIGEPLDPSRTGALEGGVGGDSARPAVSAQVEERVEPPAPRAEDIPAAPPSPAREAPRVPTTEKEAAAKAAEAITRAYGDRASFPGTERVEANFRRMLKGSQEGITEAQRGAVDAALARNSQAAEFTKWLDKFGGEGVTIIANEQSGLVRSQARRDGMINWVSSKGLEDKVPGPVQPGAYTTHTWGGLDATLRHEYAHSLETAVSPDLYAEFVKAIPSEEILRRDLTHYAAALAAQKPEEVWSELFAMVTAPGGLDALPESLRPLAGKMIKALEESPTPKKR